MSTKHANTLSVSDFNKVLNLISVSPWVVADELILKLSYYAGLRVCEIGRMTTDAFLDGNGKIAKNLTIFSHVAKKGRERTIPIHPVLREALQAFLNAYPHINYIAVGKRRPRQTVGGLTFWFWNIYKKAGLTGCSSHSGRRTFITDLARRANKFNNSLVDVQLLAGHADLKTTQIYVEPSKSTAEMVASLGSDDFDDDAPKQRKPKSKGPKPGQRRTSVPSKRKVPKPDIGQAQYWSK